MILDPAARYLLLEAHGRVRDLPGGEAFWSQAPQVLDALGTAWLASEYAFDADWPDWEMHPMADELVYVLEGDATVLIETPTGVVPRRISGRGAVVVPRGAWHTMQVHAPCRALHLTMGAGTRHRRRDPEPRDGG